MALNVPRPAKIKAFVAKLPNQKLVFPKGVDYNALLSSLLPLLIKDPQRLLAMLAILQAATGAAGTPGNLPSIPGIPVPSVIPPVVIPPIVIPPTIGGPIMSGIFKDFKGNWMNGRAGLERPDWKEGDKARYNMKAIQDEKSYYTGQEPWNGGVHKNIVIANLTPIQVDGTPLFKDEEDNENVGHVEYTIIYDGEEFVEDQIQNSPIEVNNHGANFGLTPRLVFGPGIEGHHTFTLRAKLIEHDNLQVTLPEMRIG